MSARRQLAPEIQTTNHCAPGKPRAVSISLLALGKWSESGDQATEGGRFKRQATVVRFKHLLDDRQTKPGSLSLAVEPFAALQDRRAQE